VEKSARFWAGVVAINIAASMLANIAFRDAGWHGLGQFLQASALSALFSLCCSSLCIIGLPHLVPLARRWLPFPLDWAAIVIVLIGFASAGMLVALGMLVAVGYIRSADVFVRWFAGSLKIAVITTILFGVFGTIVESLRSRLDAATLALRTKQRDEADARRVAAEAQLASLESRVHPHFLFNTLNSIAALIHDDPAGAERMTGQLASLLRSSLDQQTPLVSLEEELRTVRHYLEIERVRFGERLRYTVTADAASAGAQVPRLAVQTLVENCIKYAVSPRRDGASIVVRATANHSRVRVDVEDDGPGFDPSALPEGHGLALVRERLVRTIGEEATLQIDVKPGRTRVAIEVPLRSG
jgi:two-component system, LytTR family, sensor histidine kinase AlgZ